MWRADRSRHADQKQRKICLQMLNEPKASGAVIVAVSGLDGRTAALFEPVK